jgi:hypothetical protein
MEGVRVLNLRLESDQARRLVRAVRQLQRTHHLHDNDVADMLLALVLQEVASQAIQEGDDG